MKTTLRYISLAALFTSMALAQIAHDFGGRLIENGVNNLGTVGGTNTFTVTPSPALIAYTTGVSYCGTFTNANTGAATLNINSIAADAIVKLASTALVSGDIAAGSTHCVLFNGTAFVIDHIDNASAGSVGTTGSPSSGQMTAFSGGTTITSATAHNSILPFTCSGSASATAATCTTSPTFSPATGDVVWFVPGAQNTGAFTLNVNSSAADSLFHNGAALGGCELQTGVPVLLSFDGTHWLMPNNPILIASGVTAASSTGSLNSLGSIASAGNATLTITSACVASTDTITWTPNASLLAVVGFVPATTGGIGINAVPGSGSVKFDASNWSTGALTIGTGAQLNWRVTR